MARLHAFTDDALGDLDAVGLTVALAAGRVSIAEVIEAAIARTERVAPALNALAVDCFDRARAEAVDPRGGFFAGVPTFLKDNVDLAGVPTMQGTDAFAPRPAKRDGDFARMFLATGLVPIGKTQLSEYGFSASAEHVRLGAVRSPWSTDHTAGASSAGTGALVAAGAVPFAHGNDGGGSIRIPAAVNGLVGLKPTRGRLAQDKTLRQMPVRIVSDGVLTRSVRDSAAFLREAERVYRDLRLAPVGDVRRPGRARRSVAVVTEGIDVSATPEVDALTRETAQLLESLGHRVEWIEQPMPTTFKDDFLLYWSSLASVITATGRMEHGRSWHPERLDPFTQGLDRHCRRNLRHLPGATSRLRRSGRLSEELHGRYDVVLTPTLARETPELGWLDPAQGFDTVMSRLLEWVAFTPLQNATGAPAISLPLATTAAGLPQGMMLAAGHGGEAMLLELAYELEEAWPWPLLRDAWHTHVVHADGSSAPPAEEHRDHHRRRASHLYGLIISGAVLATAPDDFRLARVAVLLLFTLCIYWAAETYVHLMAARTLLRRDLTGAERRGIVVDGWPLVAASGIPLAALALEAVLGVETKVALDVTLGVNSVLLFFVGWQMSRAGGLTGARLVLSATVAGLLGVTMIVLKTLLH